MSGVQVGESFRFVLVVLIGSPPAEDAFIYFVSTDVAGAS